MNPAKQIALILQTRLEDNIGILKGIAAYARKNCNWHFFLDDQAMSVSDPSWLFRREWDGVICRNRVKQVLAECVRRRIPCVDLDDAVSRVPEVPNVRPDNRSVGSAGARYLLAKGYRNLAFCGHSSELWSTERRQGFVEAIKAEACRCEVFETTYFQKLTPDWDISETAAIAQWLGRMPRPLAVMACNDMRALQVIQAAKDIKLKVPEDIAVLGANNESVRAEISHPTLSSIPMDNSHWGELAAQQLHLLFDKKESNPVTYIHPLDVVVRQSTDTAAVDDPVVVKAMRIIQEQAVSNLRVEALAEQLKVSRSMLERRFRRCFRRSPQEMIRQTRILEVKDLLLNSNQTLASIAQQTGFEHPEYLTVLFKRITGETPRSFRQKHRRSHIR